MAVWSLTLYSFVIIWKRILCTVKIWKKYKAETVTFQTFLQRQDLRLNLFPCHHRGDGWHLKSLSHSRQLQIKRQKMHLITLSFGRKLSHLNLLWAENTSLLFFLLCCNISHQTDWQEVLNSQDERTARPLITRTLLYFFVCFLSVWSGFTCLCSWTFFRCFSALSTWGCISPLVLFIKCSLDWTEMSNSVVLFIRSSLWNTDEFNSEYILSMTSRLRACNFFFFNLTIFIHIFIAYGPRCWDRLQPPMTLQRIKWYGKWMDGYLLPYQHH